MKPRPDEPTVRLWLKVAADLNWNGREQWKDVQIDESIARLVWALQLGDVDMRASCSGHGRFPGNICLADGRVLLIVEARWITHPIRTLAKALARHLRHLVAAKARAAAGKLAWWLRRSRQAGRPS